MYQKGRAWIELNIENLVYNLGQLKKFLPSECAVMPAVKANAYGHGAVLIGRALQNRGIRDFCVASVKEGVELRESEHYKPFFRDYDVYGFDYKAENPWEAKEEFGDKVKELKKTYSEMILIAGSIGAYFSMNAGISEYFERAYFISPIVNLEKLILDMISWAGVSERELEEKKIIPVDFGDDLSWDYLQYVRNNKVNWNVPTEILYGSTDNLQSIDTINEFVNDNGAGLTVMEGGEHWFHTKEQMRFLDRWMQELCDE